MENVTSLAKIREDYSHFRTVNCVASQPNLLKSADDDYTLLRSVSFRLLEHMVLNGPSCILCLYD